MSLSSRTALICLVALLFLLVGSNLLFPLLHESPRVVGSERVGSNQIPADTAPRASGPRRRFLVHVGPHKTGTTSFQDTIHINDSFLRRHGFAVYGSSRKDEIDLVFRLKRSRKRDCDTFEDLCSMFRRHRGSFLLSAESIFDSLETLKYLKEIMLEATMGQEVDFVVLMLWRDPMEWMLSMWTQYLKLPRPTPPYSVSEMLSSHLDLIAEREGKMKEISLHYDTILLNYDGMVERNISLWKYFINEHLEGVTETDLEEKGEMIRNVGGAILDNDIFQTLLREAAARKCKFKNAKRRLDKSWEHLRTVILRNHLVKYKYKNLPSRCLDIAMLIDVVNTKYPPPIYAEYPPRRPIHHRDVCVLDVHSRKYDPRIVRDLLDRAYDCELP